MHPHVGPPHVQVQTAWPPLCSTLMTHADSCCCGVPLQYPLCLKLMESAKVDVNPMVTHRFGFSAKEVDAAFDTAARAPITGAIKVCHPLLNLHC